MTSLFLDDERPKPEDFDHIVRTLRELRQFLENNPFPERLSFDYYLEHGETGDDAIDLIIHLDMIKDGKLIPDNLEFQAHSSDPTRCRDMRGRVRKYLRERNK